MAIILVVDDELGIRGLLSEILTDEGHTVELAENAAQARAVAAESSSAKSSIRPWAWRCWCESATELTRVKNGSKSFPLPVLEKTPRCNCCRKVS